MLAEPLEDVAVRRTTHLLPVFLEDPGVGRPDQLGGLRAILRKQGSDQALGPVEPAPDHVVPAPVLVEERAEVVQAQPAEVARGADRSVGLARADPDDVDRVGLADRRPVLHEIERQVVGLERVVGEPQGGAQRRPGLAGLRLERLGDVRAQLRGRRVQRGPDDAGGGVEPLRRDRLVRARQHALVRLPLEHVRELVAADAQLAQCGGELAVAAHQRTFSPPEPAARLGELPPNVEQLVLARGVVHDRSGLDAAVLSTRATASSRTTAAR